MSGMIPIPLRRMLLPIGAALSMLTAPPGFTTTPFSFDRAYGANTVDALTSVTPLANGGALECYRFDPKGELTFSSNYSMSQAIGIAPGSFCQSALSSPQNGIALLGNLIQRINAGTTPAVPPVTDIPELQHLEHFRHSITPCV